jgi:Helicase HerA, central domain
MSQQQIETQTPIEKKYATITSMKFAGGTVAAAMPFEVMTHFGPSGLLVGGIVSYVAYKHGPEIYDQIRDTLPFLPALAAPRQQQDAPAQLSERKQGRSFWDRALGRNPQDEVFMQEDETGDSASAGDESSYDWYDREDEEIAPRMDSSMFTFSQLLASGFKPTLHKIFLGRHLTDGTDVFVEAKDLCHVALAGNTGNGKSSLLRLIMAQLCYIRVNVVLLNPHYMLYDRDHDEDWTPYTPYLARNPMDYVTPDNIAFMLKWIIEKTLMRRMDLARKGQSVGKPYFVVIDELPAIVAERKDVAVYVAKLLREGRKYGIFLIVASQDFLVKTTGMDDAGGAVRKCFRTACYVGGDLTTANVLLEKQATPIPETELGKGKMMLRCSATRQAVLASVPYCDNAALYQLLGPSTFTPEDIHSSPSPPQSELGEAPMNYSRGNGEYSVNAPVKRGERLVNDGEYSPLSENYSPPFTPHLVNDSPTFTADEEVQVLLAYTELLKAGEKVTRTGLRDLLKWNNKQYERIVKPVCDKHHIAE